MKILVTGGAGYVGHRLIPMLLDDGHEVIVYDLMIFGCYFEPNKRLAVVKGDIRDIATLKGYMSGCYAVIHLACISNDPSCDLDENLTTSINLLAFDPIVKAAKESGVKRFINASSSSVYGVKDEIKVTEDLTCEPLTLYSKYKLECEKMLSEYHDDNFQTVSVRSATVFGYSPRMRFDTVLNMFCLHAHDGHITVHGGHQVRPLVHIKDLAGFYVHLLYPKLDGESYNYGLENISLIDLAAKIKNDFLIKSESADNRSYRIESWKSRQTFGIYPETSLEDGIGEVQKSLSRGYYINPDKNSLYYNVKRMKEIGLT